MNCSWKDCNKPIHGLIDNKWPACNEHFKQYWSIMTDLNRLKNEVVKLQEHTNLLLEIKRG